MQTRNRILAIVGLAATVLAMAAAASAAAATLKPPVIKEVTKLNTSGKKDFISGHNAWFRYRTAYCLSESDVYQGGIEAAVVEAQCVANINSEHVKELRGFLSSLDHN
jgi:opacity protein-like surface antigen